MTTIQQAAESFLQNVAGSQAAKTAENYRYDLLGGTGFFALLAPALKLSAPVSSLTEEHAIQYMQELLDRKYSPATRQRRASAIREFYQFLEAHRWTTATKGRLNSMLKAAKLLSPADVEIVFDVDAIEKVLQYAEVMDPKNLTAARDRAFVLTLADTGLRVHEACKMRLKDVRMDEEKATVVGKGKKQASVRFTDRSLRAIKAYLTLRTGLDSAMPGRAGDLPLFSRHDKQAAGRVLPFTPTTGQSIVHDMTLAALGADYDPTLTCHKFRHYFVTRVLGVTQNLKMAQEMARHKNINVTQRYAHLADDELDRARDLVFNQ
jgi:integrase/recombinase XerC